MSRPAKVSAPLPLAGASGVLSYFIATESHPGKNFIATAVPKEWLPRLMRPKSKWAMEFRHHSAAFIAVDLGGFAPFNHLLRLPIAEARAFVRPLGAWIGSLPGVQLLDQVGGFDQRLGHWHFLYREKKISGSLDIFIFPVKGRNAILLASINEHRVS